MTARLVDGSEDSDGDIEAALREGDRRRALTILMRRYGDQVYRFAHVMTRDHHLADEVRQQVFLEAFRDLESFEGRASIRSWLLGIARYRSLDAVRQQRRWRDRFKNDALPETELDDREPGPELDRDRLAKIVAGCLTRLAPAARAAVVLRYYQELSYIEVSKLSGELPGTLQQRVARALAVLRRCVEAK